jgi:DNA-binding PadR family transcriptional regulator
MTRQASLGEFEQLVLLAILRLADAAYATRVSAELEAKAGRRLSRGALYSSLDRLESKGFLTWSLEAASAARGGQPARRFQVTERGLQALREQHAALMRLTAGLEDVLQGGGGS